MITTISAANISASISAAHNRICRSALPPRQSVPCPIRYLVSGRQSWGSGANHPCRC